MVIGSNCSGPCETCQVHFIGGCLAGHGDDDYVYANPNWLIDFNRKKSKEEFDINSDKFRIGDNNEKVFK